MCEEQRKICIKMSSSRDAVTVNDAFLYLCEGFPKAPGCPAGRKPRGPGHRNANSACSGDAAPATAAPCRRQTAGRGTRGLPRCVQTLAPGRCMHYLLGNSDKPQPTKGETQLSISPEAGRKWEQHHFLLAHILQENAPSAKYLQCLVWRNEIVRKFTWILWDTG